MTVDGSEEPMHLLIFSSFHSLLYLLFSLLHQSYDISTEETAGESDGAADN